MKRQPEAVNDVNPVSAGNPLGPGLPGDRANILVVDDRPDKIMVIETILEDLGENIVTARSGEEALRRMLEHEFAVVLLDVNMPGMDGIETASFIRARRKTGHTPIIFITAYADDVRVTQGYSLGAVDYILTPVVPDILRAKVKVFVQLHKLTHQIKLQAEQHIALAREQAARAAAEEAIKRSTFLAEASRVLSSSLDADMTAMRLTHLVVPFMADFAALAVVDEQGHARRTELAWTGPDAKGRVQSASVKSLLDAGLAQAIERALASGKAEVMPPAGAGKSALTVSDVNEGPQERLELGFALQQITVVPLVGRGRTRGVLTLGIGPVRQHLDTAALALAEELAGRAAIAFDNCVLYHQVQAADQRKNEFLAMLAHELRNPMASIRNAVEVLRAPGLDDEKFKWARDVVDRQSQQLARLIDDLLDMSRITRGKIHLKTEPVDVAAVVHAAVETCSPLIESRKHALKVTLPNEPVRVHADFARLSQVLANLLDNAAKYTEPGGRIAVSVQQEDGEAVFRVRDSGIGIPEQMLASVFELFTQANHALDRAQGGLGIGLTLVRRLIEIHGGRVQAFSAGLGRGSEFVVRLPAMPRSGETQAAGRVGQPPAQTPQKRVLVVDDNTDSTSSLSMLLQLMGHQVEVAHDGPAALAAAAAQLPEIMFLDIGLPGMSGYEVARRVRRDPELKATYLAALSGYGSPLDQQHSAEAGFDTHVVKPIELKQLQQILNSRHNQERQPANE